MARNRKARRTTILFFAFLGLAAIAGVAVTVDAAAQEIRLTSDVVQANGQATPTLTWDTTPLADNCDASGAWEGPKGGAGTELQPTITSSATYNLRCTWAGDSVTLSWIPATENTDGTPYTDAGGYRISYGPGPEADPAALGQQIDLDQPELTSFVVEGLIAGVWSFAMESRNLAGVHSDFSEILDVEVFDDEASETIGITINPKPLPPSGLRSGSLFR